MAMEEDPFVVSGGKPEPVTVDGFYPWKRQTQYPPYPFGVDPSFYDICDVAWEGDIDEEKRIPKSRFPESPSLPAALGKFINIAVQNALAIKNYFRKKGPREIVLLPQKHMCFKVGKTQFAVLFASGEFYSDRTSIVVKVDNTGVSVAFGGQSAPLEPNTGIQTEAFSVYLCGKSNVVTVANIQPL